MAQITTGIRSILSHPKVYNIVQQIVGERKPKSTLINEHIRPFPGCKILDVGCGTGEMFPYIEEACPQVDYTGIDLSQRYLDIANEKYGERAKFICMNVLELTATEESRYDVVMCAGFLHHIDDETVLHLTQTAKRLLKPNGKFFAMEIVYTDDQSAIARYLISKDRGQNVRDENGYFDLLTQEFSSVESTVYHNLHNIPYTNIVYECQNT